MPPKIVKISPKVATASAKTCPGPPNGICVERDRMTAAQIARELGLCARTVREWLKEPYRPRKRARRASMLDPFKGRIMGMLQQHPSYSAVQLLSLLREQGFT
ncbi:MAG: hypothetical protein WCQ44_10770, partial [Opitutaceae bacterium]